MKHDPYNVVTLKERQDYGLEYRETVNGVKSAIKGCWFLCWVLVGVSAFLCSLQPVSLVVKGRVSQHFIQKL